MDSYRRSENSSLNGKLKLNIAFTDEVSAEEQMKLVTHWLASTGRTGRRLHRYLDGKTKIAFRTSLPYTAIGIKLGIWNAPKPRFYADCSITVLDGNLSVCYLVLLIKGGPT